ncbi:MAG: rod shape-determining protein MreD [Thermoanaerobaculia bacterium]|nr:MAG: rod shape-determining protein MreD [Thermoanaerobaculia bacterium]
MRFARFALGLVAAALVHFAAARATSSFPLAADLFLLVTVLVARAGRPVEAMFAGLVCGWTADALSGMPFGLHGLADSVVGYGTARVAQQLVVQRRTSLLSIFAAGAAAQSALLAVLIAVFVPDGGLPSLVWLPVKVASTALLGLAWASLAAALDRRWSGRRRKRAGGVVNIDR